MPSVIVFFKKMPLVRQNPTWTSHDKSKYGTEHGSPRDCYWVKTRYFSGNKNLDFSVTCTRLSATIINLILPPRFNRERRCARRCLERASRNPEAARRRWRRCSRRSASAGFSPWLPDPGPEQPHQPNHKDSKDCTCTVHGCLSDLDVKIRWLDAQLDQLDYRQTWESWQGDAQLNDYKF